ALANWTSLHLGRTADTAIELVMPLTAREEAKPKQEIAMSAAEAVDYAGVYVNGSARTELLVKDGKLFIKQAAIDQPVVKMGENRFALASPGSRQEFVIVTGAAGQAEFLHRGLRSLKRVQTQQ